MQTVSYSAVVIRLLALKRQAAGIEQAEMAQRLGLTPSSYSRLEAGHTALTVDTLFSIADVLSVNIPDLMGKAERVIQEMESSHQAHVAAQARKNTVGAGEQSNVGTFVTGAALGALIAAMLSK